MASTRRRGGCGECSPPALASSNVIETCLKLAPAEGRQTIVDELLASCVRVVALRRCATGANLTHRPCPPVQGHSCGTRPAPVCKLRPPAGVRAGTSGGAGQLCGAVAVRGRRAAWPPCRQRVRGDLTDEVGARQTTRAGTCPVQRRAASTVAHGPRRLRTQEAGASELSFHGACHPWAVRRGGLVLVGIRALPRE